MLNSSPKEAAYLGLYQIELILAKEWYTYFWIACVLNDFPFFLYTPTSVGAMMFQTALHAV